jgi:hypothetical protein
MAASIPISLAPSTTPAGSTSSPRRALSPDARTFSPAWGASMRVTVAVSSRTSSMGMTASAPSGIGAPVMIRTASPAPGDGRSTAPAAISPTTRKVAPGPTSSERTANPSIAELANGGMSPGARTSAASTVPRASSRALLVGGSGATRLRTSCR